MLQLHLLIELGSIRQGIFNIGKCLIQGLTILSNCLFIFQIADRNIFFHIIILKERHNVDRLEKRVTRAYRRTLFGSLSNVWLFDRRCVKPDKANASALALLPRDSAHRLDRLWMLVRDTCPLPLLDHWRETVLDLLQSREMLARLPFALGPLEGHRLAIDVPALSLALGSLIRSDALTAYPYPAKIWTPEAVAA